MLIMLVLGMSLILYLSEYMKFLIVCPTKYVNNDYFCFRILITSIAFLNVHAPVKIKEGLTCVCIKHDILFEIVTY